METEVLPARTPRRAPRQAQSTLTVDGIFEGAIQVLLSDGPTRFTRVAQRQRLEVAKLVDCSKPHSSAICVRGAGPVAQTAPPVAHTTSLAGRRQCA
jgi:hypothetical protein